ncbi:MAG: hypothetical protein COA57_02845 [Flavobacteriales bacterium]|nr:hypothetical protein [Bacteroidales bacterium AH-315-I05]PCJ89054.1 MAG: hypothetical protein COA57_02845 [Flavobacteriales bacterium]
MKTKTIFGKLLVAGGFLFGTTIGFAQPRQTVAILNIDTKGVIQDATAMGYLARLELEKTNVYNVMDKYDIADILEKNKIDISNCFGKTCLVEKGKVLGADKMLTGSVERFGEKIVITLRLIDVKTASVEKSDATEYLNLQPEIQKMMEISVKNLLQIENDPILVNLLVEYDTPITSPKTTLRLNGPRMGVSFVTAEAAKRLTAPKSEGGYDMFPITSQFGYQFETQYLSAGNFQALIEFVGSIGGLESGQLIPSLAFMNGFRGSKSGLEFAFGPVFKVVKTADGYFDKRKTIGDGKWHLNNEWSQDTLNWINENKYDIIDNPNDVMELPDRRGKYKLSTGLILALGKTFKSGYLNIPVNVYVIPKKHATVYGISVGFNINKKPKRQ